MAQQFSHTVASLVNTPKLASSTPPHSPSLPATAESHSQPPQPTFDFIPKLIPNPATTVRGRVIIFNTLTNTFSRRTLGPGESLRSVVLTSPKHRIHSMPIRLFKGKVDLRAVSVKVGEGQVDELTKELPRLVVVMRVLGWYKRLYVVRNVEDVEDK